MKLDVKLQKKVQIKS
ncbi:Protein of unknown function [Bacillus cereus]|nr:Protein of unknown function [Bacillus cereus]